MKGAWNVSRRYWKLLVLFTVFWYAAWILANWILPFYGMTEELRLMVIVGGMGLAFTVTVVAYSLGWGALKCPMCGELLEERREGNVIVFHCSTHGDVRGIILEDEG